MNVKQYLLEMEKRASIKGIGAGLGKALRAVKQKGLDKGLASNREKIFQQKVGDRIDFDAKRLIPPKKKPFAFGPFYSGPYGGIKSFKGKK